MREELNKDFVVYYKRYNLPVSVPTISKILRKSKRTIYRIIKHMNLKSAGKERVQGGKIRRFYYINEFFERYKEQLKINEIEIMGEGND